MKKKLIRFVGMLGLALAAVLFVGKPVQAADKVTNNGDDVVQCGSYIYYIANKGDSSSHSCELCRIKTNNKSKKVLDSWDGYTYKLFLSGDKIYYQRGDSVYCNPLNKKSPKKIVTGTLLGVYGKNIYYASGTYGNTSLYTIGTNKKGKKKLLSGYDSISGAGTSGKVLIVNAQASTEKMDIVYVNMSKKTAKVLTTEGMRNSYDVAAASVMDMYIYNSTLYYASGILQGSGLFFAGDFKKIGLNGKGKKTIATDIGAGEALANTQALLHASGGYLYYYKDGVKKYKLSTGKISKVTGAAYYQAAGKYAYYAEGDSGTTKLVVYRYALNSGEKKAKKLITLKKTKNYTYSISDILLVGKYLYIDFDVRSFEGTNWRGEYKGTETYKMTTSGKSAKKLN